MEERATATSQNIFASMVHAITSLCEGGTLLAHHHLLLRVDPRSASRRRRTDEVFRGVLSARPQAGPLGDTLLVTTFGRIGARGRVMAVHYDDESITRVALQQHAVPQKQRGYVAGIKLNTASQNRDSSPS
jgi:predicted DNA-binding WGR domain protein